MAAVVTLHGGRRSGIGVRWFVRALVLMLVPSVWLFAASAAEASTVYGATARATITVDNTFPGSDIHCDLLGYWKTPDGATSPSAVIKGSCAYHEFVIDGRLALHLTANGGACNMVGETSGNFGSEQSFAFSMVAAPGASFAGCSVSTMTYSIDVEPNPPLFGEPEPVKLNQFHGDTSFVLGAAPVPDTTPVAQATSCEHFDLASITAKPDWASGTTTTKIITTIRGVRKTAAAGVVFRTYIQNTAGDVQAQNQQQYEQGATITAGVSTNTEGGWTASGQDTGLSKSRWDSEGWTVKGVEMIIQPYWFAASAGQKALAHKMTWPDNRPGVPGAITNDPTNCRWYVGQLPSGIHVADPSPSGTASITPYAGLYAGTTTAPQAEPTDVANTPVAESNCDGFSFTDPSSWAGAGICRMVSLMQQSLGWLRAIASGIGSLAALIVDGIRDALSGLFVPSDGAMDAMSDDLQATAEDSNYGLWKGSFVDGIAGALPGDQPAPSTSAKASTLGDASYATTTAAECKGPAITWDVLTSVGLPDSIYPMEACEGRSADMARWSHLILTMVVSIGGALKIFEMLMIALGVTKQTQIIAGHDWSRAVIKG